MYVFPFVWCYSVTDMSTRRWLNAQVCCHLIEANVRLSERLFTLEICPTVPPDYHYQLSFSRFPFFIVIVKHSGTTFGLPTLSATSEGEWPPCEYAL